MFDIKCLCAYSVVVFKHIGEMIMGMYTGLRGTVNLKREYLSKIKSLVSRDLSWMDILPECCSEFYTDSRASFIPFGIICYLDWDEVVCGVAEDGVFSFACSLKNYNNTIEKFLEYVLPEIAESYYLEEQYEEDEDLTIHTKVIDDK